MGVCASSSAAQEQQPDSAPIKQQQTQPHQIAGKQAAAPSPVAASSAPVQPASARSSTKSSAISPVPLSEDEYRSQIKSIFLFLVDRLLQTLEYERESMHRLAALQTNTSVEQASYLTLFGSEGVEQFIRATFDLSNVSIPAVAANGDRTLAEQNFILLLKGAQQVSDSGPALDRATLTSMAKSVCADTQGHLRKAQEVLAANQQAFPNNFKDLDAHFAFFVRTLNFTQGDIANDAQLLERNVEEIIGGSA